MAHFLLNDAFNAGDSWTPEFKEEFVKGHVVGYLNGKVVVFDSGYDIEESRREQREQEKNVG